MCSRAGVLQMIAKYSQCILAVLGKSLDSFLDFFAAFFSFGVIAGFFFSSL